MYRELEQQAFQGNRCLIEGLAVAAGGDTPR
jgi:hypothetical protein